MALIKTSDGYLVNPYWCTTDWFIRVTDDEFVIGVRVGRRDTSDKTIQTRMRSCLRHELVKGRVDKVVIRESGVFIREGGGFNYKPAGISNLLVADVMDINKELMSSGLEIRGESVDGTNLIWNNK
jgi:hypothetical protein